MTDFDMENETLVYERPESLTDVSTHYCPGCTHGVAHRLIAEVLDEMGIREKTIGVASWVARYLPTTILILISFNLHMEERLPWRPASSVFYPRRPSLLIRVTAIWLPSEWAKLLTRPHAEKTSPFSSLTTPTTA
jgi:hypothetical protein